jgi:tRNA threonylcarbamoyladenosine biosynthesis protein TsaB
MLILGIESATESVGVALGTHDGVVASVEIARGRRHAETIVPAVDFVCRQADVALADVAVVAVDVGPGLFTGMRVGIATSKALAMALRVPMIGITSLDLLAFPARHSERVVVPVIDARKGEVFWAMYRQVPGGVQQVLAPTVGSPEDLAADLMARGQESLCIGDGAERYREVLGEVHHAEVAGPRHPSAGSLVELAHARALREEWVDHREIVPVYLRQPDAQINWDTRQVRP